MTSPIPVDFAFLDSGTGGLPYMQYLRDAYPTATCMYLADTKNFPYGQKTEKEILVAAISAVSAILTCYKPSIIVVACNTMSVTALDSLRKKFPAIPFVGTVPAIKLGAKLTTKKRIGLLATQSTVENPYTKRLEKQFAPDCVVVERGDPELVNFIEHDLDSASCSEIEKAIMPSINFFIEGNVDIIVLGCTHFLRIAMQIQTIADKVTQTKNCQRILVIDSRDGVVRQAMRVASGLISKTNISATSMDTIFYITGKEPSHGFYETVATKAGIKYGGVI
jgi:glutamate racemase